MNPINRIAITVVRLVAGGFLLVGVLNIALYYYQCHRDHAEVHFGRLVYLSIPLVIGCVILAYGSRIAQHINEFLDE